MISASFDALLRPGSSSRPETGSRSGRADEEPRTAILAEPAHQPTASDGDGVKFGCGTR